MKVAVPQINPTLGGVREKPRRAEAPAIFGTPGETPEPPGREHIQRSPGHRLQNVTPRSRAGLIALLVPALLVAGLASCRSGEVDEPAPAPGAPAPSPGGGAAGAPIRRTTQKASDRKPPFASAPWRIPVGPKLIIEPGQGLGPIRFGATLETIERLIGEPCEEKREQAGDVVCRYSAQAVDFVLHDGKVVEMRGHRLGRPFKPEPKLDYGIFNGRFAQGVAFGMLPAAATELLGAPQQVRPVTEENPNHTVEVHEYDGFRLEFDRISAESVVLGGVVLTAPKGRAQG
jgi:hypothetical protein